MSQSDWESTGTDSMFEAVRNVKARYFKYLDSKDWNKLLSVFTEAAEFDGFPFDTDNPRNFVANVRDYFEDVQSVHQGFMPILETFDETTIRGSWTMHDYLVWPKDSRAYRGEFIPGLTGIRGYGIYEDEYKFVGGEWRISRMRLVRTRVELITEELNLLPLDRDWAAADPNWIE